MSISSAEELSSYSNNDLRYAERQSIRPWIPFIRLLWKLLLDIDQSNSSRLQVTYKVVWYSRCFGFSMATCYG